MENFYGSGKDSNLSLVLQELLKKLDNISGSELAKKTGIPASTINRILAGTVVDPRVSTLKPLANFFGVSVDQLLGYVELPNNFIEPRGDKIPSISIPNYSYNSLIKKSSTPLKWFTWVSENNRTSDNCFALTLDTNKYEPIFEKDTTLIVEPSLLPPQHNDYVVVKFDHKEYIHIRKFYIDDNDAYFVPLNPQLKATKLISIEHENIGIITEAHSKLR